MKTVNVWKVEGYRGNTDFEGREDYNMSVEVNMDKDCTAEDVVGVFTRRYEKRYKFVFFEATLIGEKEVVR
jgi:uncharacterized protein YciU (UPF0263 family)